MDPSALAIFAVMRSIVMRRSVLPVTLDPGSGRIRTPLPQA